MKIHVMVHSLLAWMECGDNFVVLVVVFICVVRDMSAVRG